MMMMISIMKSDFNNCIEILIFALEEEKLN